MQRGRERRGTEYRAPAARLDHGHPGGPADFLFDTDALVEPDEVGAAPEKDVLAVVDDFADARMQVRGSAAAEVGAALGELHVVAGLSERASGAHAGYSAADDGDGAECELLYCFRQVCALLH